MISERMLGAQCKFSNKVGTLLTPYVGTFPQILIDLCFFLPHPLALVEHHDSIIAKNIFLHVNLWEG